MNFALAVQGLNINVVVAKFKLITIKKEILLLFLGKKIIGKAICFYYVFCFVGK